MEYLKENYNVKVIIKKVPKFIGTSECLAIKGHPNVCFVHGGYGSPAIADTVETLNVILLVSDKHPISQEDQKWKWGSHNFDNILKSFINHSIKYSMNDD